jgi:cation:H+ antiporter
LKKGGFGPLFLQKGTIQMIWIQEFIASQAGLVVGFLLAVAVVVVAGIKLSLYGDALGERTGLGSGLIGLIFLAAVTSLPEVVVSLTSVLKATDPVTGADLAIGNMLGSNIFNLIILALLALLFRNRFDPRKLQSPHTDSALYGLILLALFAGAFFSARTLPLVVPFLGCGAVILSLPVVYGFILKRENGKTKPVLMAVDAEEDKLPSEEALTHLPAARFYSVLTLLCGFIIGGGVLLSILGSRMALPPEQGGFGLEASLIGTLFLAISTSLPELVISFSSVRLGFLDMSVGNVLGSNLFNLLIVFLADLAMRGGNILAYASRQHAVSIVLIALLTGLSMLLLRAKSRLQTQSLAGGMLLLYIVAFILTS